MSSFIKFTFDIFAHVIPGLMILVALSLLTISLKPPAKEKKIDDTQIKTIKTTELDFGLASKIMNNLEGTEKGVALVILAYIVGFAVNPLGKNMYRKFCRKLWPKIQVENEVKDMFISDKFVLIRELSPTNFEYVERWNMYSSLSHNLAVGCLVFFIVSILQTFVQFEYWLYWLSIAIISILLFFVFIKSAAVYNQWAGRDLNSAISALNLKAKAEYKQ